MPADIPISFAGYTAPRYLQLSTFKAYDNISDKIIDEASATD
jgi:hypothetical protein